MPTRRIHLKYLVSLVVIALLLLWGAALYGQAAREDATMNEAQTGVRVPAGPGPNAGDLIETQALRHSLEDKNCASGALSCGPLDFAGKARYFAGQTFTPGAFIGPLFWSVPILARPPAHYLGSGAKERVREAGCTGMRLPFRRPRKQASF